jgi:uncharacterized protein (TIGR02611 family)
VRPALNGLGRWARRAAVLIAGAALLAGGAILLVLPGPGIALLLAGLAVLATEFHWARRLLTWVRERARRAAAQARQRTSPPWSRSGTRR